MPNNIGAKFFHSFLKQTVTQFYFLGFILVSMVTDSLSITMETK